MKKTQEKILTNAIILFNRMGVSNVRLQDIAVQAGISAGNLSYHYKTKKDLIEAVLDFMQARFEAMNGANMGFVEKKDYFSLMRNYLRFQIGHRFFNRDILEIHKLVPKAKDIYKSQMRQILNFSENGTYLAIGKGLLVPEPHEGHYDIFVKNMWAILNSWLLEREILGEETVSMEAIILAILEFYYPYFTEKGKGLYAKWKKQVPELMEAERNVVA